MKTNSGQFKKGEVSPRKGVRLSDEIKLKLSLALEDAKVCEELWNINNGRTLCVPCHKKTDTYGNRVKNYE